jgi:hypothetical protein
MRPGKTSRACLFKPGFFDFSRTGFSLKGFIRSGTRHKSDTLKPVLLYEASCVTRNSMTAR